jgi:cob(I)alamin adenosyltransferase
VHVQNPPEPEDVEMARAGFAKLRQAMLSGRYQIVVADEIITTLFFHLLTVDEVRALMREKPNQVELILTGRYCPAEIIAAADLVTEMCEVKHYYAQNVPARDGVER